MTDEECREFRQRYLDIRSQLVLEITEQELLSKEALERKTSKGFLGAVALDDYGSGYNSEKSLLALSPKYIKVDMVIIRDIDTDIDKQQIVANIEVCTSAWNVYCCGRRGDSGRAQKSS